MPIDFADEFSVLLSGDRVDFDALGFICTDDIIYPIGTDTKVLSTVFELICRPFVNRLANTHRVEVVESPQTIYPDFTIMRNEADTRKIAVDIKTTYRRPNIQFTLGSYTSFLRNGTKNIKYPYDQYAEHWIVGFVYDRVPMPERERYHIEDRRQHTPPYTNVEFFIQEKHKISGDKPGSGNTANIGSIKSRDIEDFRQGRGPFSSLGEDVFRRYWSNFGRTADGREYNNIDEYLEIYGQ